jgi:cation diffusion facilitator CzcD-associated flavoprotein CzcO
MSDQADFDTHAATFVRPENLVIGSNTPGSHPASTTRPAYHPSYDAVSERGYRINELLINEIPREPFKVVVIGAGAAGIDFLHHARQTLPQLNVEFECFEKNADIGGTWFENRYPGCACDIPSASYQFAWRPNPDWTSYYSGAKEIWRYLKMIATEEDMYKYIKLRTAVKRAEWNEEKSRWVIHLVQTDDAENVIREWDEEANVLFNGTGFLKYEIH